MKNLILITILFLFTKIIYSENQESIEIIAETMEWNKENGQAIATGNAKATKGNTIINADKITAILNNNTDSQKIIKLLAFGNVQFSKDNQLATGNTAIYYLDQNKIILNGNVSLKREGNIIKGEKLTIDFQTGLSKMVGSNSKKKVKMKYSTE